MCTARLLLVARLAVSRMHLSLPTTRLLLLHFAVVIKSRLSATDDVTRGVCDSKANAFLSIAATATAPTLYKKQEAGQVGALL